MVSAKNHSLIVQENVGNPNLIRGQMQFFDVVEFCRLPTEFVVDPLLNKKRITISPPLFSYHFQPKICGEHLIDFILKKNHSKISFSFKFKNFWKTPSIFFNQSLCEKTLKFYLPKNTLNFCVLFFIQNTLKFLFLEIIKKSFKNGANLKSNFKFLWLWILGKRGVFILIISTPLYFNPIPRNHSTKKESNERKKLRARFLLFFAKKERISKKRP